MVSSWLCCGGVVVASGRCPGRRLSVKPAPLHCCPHFTSSFLTLLLVSLPSEQILLICRYMVAEEVSLRGLANYFGGLLLSDSTPSTNKDLMATDADAGL